MTRGGPKNGTSLSFFFTENDLWVLFVSLRCVHLLWDKVSFCFPHWSWASLQGKPSLRRAHHISAYRHTSKPQCWLFLCEKKSYKAEKCQLWVSIFKRRWDTVAKFWGNLRQGGGSKSRSFSCDDCKKYLWCSLIFFKKGPLRIFLSPVVRDWNVFSFFTKYNQGSTAWGNHTEHFELKHPMSNSSGEGATSQKEG